MTLVYLIRAGSTEYVKIGMGKYPHSRIPELQVGCWERLAVELIIPGGRERERELHQRFQHLRLRGEWFRDDGTILAAFREADNDSPA